MFTQGLRGRGLGRLGEFINEPRKVEYWLQNGVRGASVIPGVANSTAAVAAGGVGLLAALAAAYMYFKK